MAERQHVRVRRHAIRRVAPGFVVLVLIGCGSGSGSDSQPRATTGASHGGRSPTTRTPATDPALPSAADQRAAIRRFAARQLPIYCGGRQGNLVALTFDDGPGPYTSIALRELRQAGARATFFLVGRSIARFPDAARPERDLAAIGDHTRTHANLSSLSTAAAMDEVREGRAAAIRAVGPPVDLFRPPYGAHTDAIDKRVGGDGMVEVLWDVDSADSRVSPPADFHEISANVRHRIRPGSIVLMHENRGQTIRALRAILPALRRRRLRPVTVPELLAADPPSIAQLRAGRSGCGRRQPSAGSGG